MTTVLDQRLLTLLTAAVDGNPPPGSPGGVEVVARPSGPSSAVTVLSGYAVVAADVDPDWVFDHLPPGLNAADEHHPVLSVAFLGALGARLGIPPSGLSVLLGVPATEPGCRAGRLVELDDHPGAWSDYRTEVRSYRYVGPSGSAAVSIGRGPARRWETWVEPTRSVGPERGTPGPLRASPNELLGAVRGLVPPHNPVFTAVPSASATALVHALAVGFDPLGAEVLFHHEGHAE
ncbi:MAG: hypothetical protein J2P19_09135 [Pseudonocardia sp.]|nr:hypothetical protein [Pseudonocardia sp.]